jgi:uncharacterized protein involved in exopolysaccharide biosynthesis
MAEHAAWRVKRVTLAVPVPSPAALRARAWMIGPPLLLGLLAALIATQVTTKARRSEAVVLIQLPSTPASLAGDIQPSGLEATSPQYMKTQAKIAHSPELARRVVAAAGLPGETPGKFLRQESASPQAETNILKLTVSSSSRADLARLVNTWAEEFTKYRAALYSEPIEQLLRRIQARLDSLRTRGQTGTPAYQDLLQQRDNLQSSDPKLANNAVVLKRASGASSFRPHLVRNGLLGGAFGALLGVALTTGVAARRRTHG